MNRRTSSVASVGRTMSCVFVASAGLLASSGCDSAGEGAMSGAALGALAGMGIGSLTGDMGKGAAAGAIIGGVGGAVLGDQNDRKDSRSRNSDW